jgi:hypothetical protein
MDILLSLPTDDQFTNKLTTACRLSENGTEGDVHFVQVTNCPVTLLFLITGRVRDDSTTLHEVHMRLVGQTSDYPDVPANMYSTQKKGYKHHLEKARNLYQADNSVGFNTLDFQTYREMFMNICQHIDNARRVHHGIKCYNDGNLENNVFSNVFYIHVCDVLNILKCERNNQPMPAVFIQTTMFEEVLREWRNALVYSMLTVYELEFLVQEIDFFYTCFAYYGNYSMLPVRTRVDEGCNVLSHSSFFTNNEHFVEHQKG